MKYLVSIAFIAGLLIGTNGMQLEFGLEDIARQDCKGKEGQVVFLNTIKVNHPLGENTCGEMNKVAGIDL